MENKYQYNFQQIADDGSIIPQKSNDTFGKWETLPPDIYQLGVEQMSLFAFALRFTPQKKKDRLISFSSGVVVDVIEKVDRFLSEDTVKGYKEMEVCHKLGMILYGPPGTGKTCTAFLAMKKLREKYSAICLDITDVGINNGIQAVELIRKYQNNPVVLFVDEIESDIRRNISYYLPYLDGNKSLDGTILMGCTNYIDRIEDRIKNRKSRIKHLFEVKSLPKEVYDEYITSKLPAGTAKSLIDKFSFLAIEKNLTIDQLKNALIDYRIDKVKVKTAIEIASRNKDEGKYIINEEEGEDDIDPNPES